MLRDHANLDPIAADLLGPVAAVIETAIERLPGSPSLAIRIGHVPGFYELRGDELVLSDGLLGPELHHPGEVVEVMPPLDRWRRAAASVLEAFALRGLARSWRVQPGSDWRWVGAAIDLADEAAPELELAQPDVALAIRHGDPGQFPRSGVAVYRHARATGLSVRDRTGYLLTGGVISAPEWAGIAAWILDPAGAGASLPVVVRHPEPIDVPAALGSWSWRPVRVPGHARGGMIEVEGDGFVESPWAVAGTELRTLAAAAGAACRLVPRAGGPVGRWELASAQGFGQVFGSRGVVFVFHPDGRLEVVLADAFVGPLAALAMAEDLGTSGTAHGRWRVEGRYLLGFEGIASYGLTMHRRSGEGFMVPATGFGLGEWLKALEEGEWAWQFAEADRLVMRGRMMGGQVEVRMKKVE